MVKVICWVGRWAIRTYCQSQSQLDLWVFVFGTGIETRGLGLGLDNEKCKRLYVKREVNVTKRFSFFVFEIESSKIQKYDFLRTIKLQNIYFKLSKVQKLTVNTMGIKALLFLCLLQSFVMALPTDPLRSYVDCSKYGNPKVSFSFNILTF